MKPSKKKMGYWHKHWKYRKIDWKTSYLDTVNHPHRNILIYMLRQFPWVSLFEIGCGPGPNLLKIIQHFPGTQVGGVDLNESAIKLANETFRGALLKIGDVQDIMLSDNSVDVVLSDMCLIYLGPRQIHIALKEIKRVARKYVLICELTTPNRFEYLSKLVKSGYHMHNYQKLLKKHGFYDIIEHKMTTEDWPDAEYQPYNGYVLLAKVPKRK